MKKEKKRNNGELPMYHAAGTHEAIIPQETFDAVQAEIQLRNKKSAPKKAPRKYPFSGKITCDICGKHYRRKTTATGPVWICSTYNTYGKSKCPSKAIPEQTLLSVAATVADVGEITAVTAKNGNTLVFTDASGKETVKQWHDRSRSESWTEEMRNAAGEKTRQRHQNAIAV